MKIIILAATFFMLVGQPLLSYATSLTRGPYLQQMTPNSVIVVWRTDIPSDSVVYYGTTTDGLIQIATDNDSVIQHEVKVSGLQPSTRYYYSIGSSDATLVGGDSEHFFQTAPTVGTRGPVRIWILGDSGTADSNASAVRDAMLSEIARSGQDIDLWLMLGDNAYDGGTDDEYQAAVFDMYPSFLRNYPLWPTLGNHDGNSASSATQSGPYYDIFVLPKNGESGGLSSGTEAYYSFDYANVHFICLDSYDSDRSVSGAMLTWLANDLASTVQDWIIAYWHHPPYTKGSHDSDMEIWTREMRENALPILEAGGVDLVLGGHSHSYERSFLIDGHYDTLDTLVGSMIIDDGNGREDGDGAYEKDFASNDGTIYVVAGSSGMLGGGLLNHPVMIVSFNALGSVVLDINGNQMDTQFLSETGEIDDYFTIAKSLSPIISQPTSPLPNGTVGEEYSVTFAASGGSVTTWNLTSGSIPPGITLSSTGDYSGTPTIAGTYTFTVTATNPLGTDSKEFVHTINEGENTESAAGDGEGEDTESAGGHGGCSLIRF